MALNLLFIILENDSWIDFSLIKLTKSRSFENQVEFINRKIKLVDRNINIENFIKDDLELAYKKKKIFAKNGNATQLKIGNLHNENKQDCHVKIQGTNVTTMEHCFCSPNLKTSPFALPGDSGALVFNKLDGTVFGIVMAASIPVIMYDGLYLTIVTPFDQVKSIFEKKFGKKLVLA